MLARAGRAAYSAVMTDAKKPPPGAGSSDSPEDLAALSHRFVGLWQEQVGLMAQDPATAQAMAQATAMMSQMLSGMWGAAPGAGMPGVPGMPFPMPPAAGPGTSGGQGEKKDDAPGTEAAAAASGERDRLLSELLERVERLERRLDDLASEPRRKGGGTAKKPRARRKP